MYFVHPKVAPDGGKIIDIAGQTKQGHFVDGAGCVRPGETFRGKPYDFWKPGVNYDRDFNELPNVWKLPSAKRAPRAKG